VRTLELAVVYWRGLEDTPPQGSEITLDLVAYPPGLWVDTVAVTQAIDQSRRLISVPYVVERSAAGVWNALGSGPGSAVNCLVYGPDGNLYAGINAAPGVKVWDGSTWATYQGGVNGAVHALLWFDNQLYVGGSFTQAGGSLACANIAFYETGSGWSAMGGGRNGTIYVLTLVVDVSDGDMYVYVGGAQTNKLDRWSLVYEGWDVFLTAALNGTVYAVTPAPNSGNGIYFAGAFTSYGAASVTRVAFYDNDTDVVALGDGQSDTVYALLALPDGRLLAGGSGLYSGSTLIRYLGIWNGVAWFSAGLSANTTWQLIYDGTRVLVVSANGFPHVLVGNAFYRLDVLLSSTPKAVAADGNGRVAAGGVGSGMTVDTSVVSGVTNPGQAACPFSLVLSGGGSFSSLFNLTSDEMLWGEDMYLVAGEAATLDTGSRTLVTDLRGDVSFSVVPGSVYPLLHPGENVISLFLRTGSGQASLRFYPRYASWEFGDGD
jgi:hypothetical protein